MKGKRRSHRTSHRTTLAVAFALIVGLGATVPATADTPYPFRDPTLSVSKREIGRAHV